MSAEYVSDGRERRASGGETACPTPPSLPLVSASVGALVVACVLCVALACHLLFAAPARGWLGFGFDPPPATAATALQTLRANAALATLALLDALSLSQLRAGSRAAPELGTTPLVIARAGFDLLIAAIAALNVCVVGLALGAYGPRMARALAPHAPVELAAFSLALAAYWMARRQELAPRRLLGAWGGAMFLLALAAALETWGAA